MIWGLFAVAVILMCLTSNAFAQTTAREGDRDSYYIGYYGNANMAGFPHTAELNILNPGSSGGYSVGDPNYPGEWAGDLCANIYVFVSDQQMVECCSCFISPNGLRTLSVDSELTSNPLTVDAPHAGVIKIVSSEADGFCSGTVSNEAGKTTWADVAGTGYQPEGSLRSWITHIRAATGSLYTLTETSFRHADLGHESYGDSSTGNVEDRDGRSELSRLQQGCLSLELAGSGSYGHCTCGTGD